MIKGEDVDFLSASVSLLMGLFLSSKPTSVTLTQVLKEHINEQSIVEKIMFMNELNAIKDEYAQKQEIFYREDTAVYKNQQSFWSLPVKVLQGKKTWWLDVYFYTIPACNINKDMVIALEKKIIKLTGDDYIYAKRLLISKEGKSEPFDYIDFMYYQDNVHAEDDPEIFPFTVSIDGKQVFYVKTVAHEKRRQLSWRKKENNTWLKYQRFYLPHDDEYVDITFMEHCNKIVLLKKDESFKLIALDEPE